MKRKDENDIDLCACYEPEEPTPEEFIDPGDREPTLADTAIYITDENGVEYYCCGNTKIKITEHFAEVGRADQADRRPEGTDCGAFEYPD